MPPKLFRFIHFAKNASATPLVSHTFKTKDLKPFRFTHFQKKGGGPFRIHQSPVTTQKPFPVPPIYYKITKKRAPRVFTSTISKKQRGGGGGAVYLRTRIT